MSRFLPGRWVLIGIAAALALLVVELAVPGGVLRLLLQDLAFNPISGWNGYLILWGALVFMLASVFVWGALSVFILTFLGAEAWFYARPAAARANRRTGG